MNWSQVIVGALVLGFSMGIGKELTRDALFAIRNAACNRRRRLLFEEAGSAFVGVNRDDVPTLKDLTEGK